ncbi:hypothetical protein XM50_08430 [Sphingomonas sp. Ag1]|nr:hypothetical protein XM50_08430 [Sphingomonas sp. Ag1]
MVDRIASLMITGTVRALRGLLVCGGTETADYLARHLSALCEATGTVSDDMIGVRALNRQTISR